jgi:hypothetical protein
LIGNRSEHWPGNLLHFHECATRKPQKGELHGEPQAIRSSSAAMNELSFFLGKRIVACNISVGEVRRDLRQCMSLFGVEVGRDLVVSGHSKCLSNFALFVSYRLLGVNKTAWDGLSFFEKLCPTLLQALTQRDIGNNISTVTERCRRYK